MLEEHSPGNKGESAPAAAQIVGRKGGEYARGEAELVEVENRELFPCGKKRDES